MRNHHQIACLLAFVAATVGCQERNEFKPPPTPSVTVAKPLVREVQEFFETTGQTRAEREVQLVCRVGGYLEEFSFKDGDLVKKDDKLFLIDPDTYAASVDSAKAALKRAEAQLLLAEQQLTRTAQLTRENASTASAMETQQAMRDSSAADVEAAKAALKQAELNLSYTVVTAPFDGRMGRHLIDVGNLVTSGTTILGSLQSVDPIHAYFNVSESDLLRFMERIRSGKMASADVGPIPLEMALGSVGEFKYHGKLDFRAFGINSATGTTERRGVFDNESLDLVPGMFVRIRAALGDPRKMILIDPEAVGRSQAGDYVLVVDAEKIVRIRPIKLGPRDNGLQAVEFGLLETDLVIINGLLRARPDSKVEFVESTMDARLLELKKRRESLLNGGHAPVKDEAPESKPVETATSPATETSPADAKVPVEKSSEEPAK
ncbi:efflux RND transporter periplasmic adaptor subunit [Planctomicrobium sp. SH668]|uniref:efflux RND transporter periplasmic adaptor subunit n=1 Tax=Planctomicrobium sp. SH668 TaxID=3448126 RepID=UPI003F5B81C0